MNKAFAGVRPGRGTTKFVAASNSSGLSKFMADYVCDGVADQVEILAAMTAVNAAPGGGKVLLSEGTFNATGILGSFVGVTVSGFRRGTQILHTASTNAEVINTASMTHCVFEELYVNGNRPNNKGDVTGWTGSEINFAGTYNKLLHVDVDNFNGLGIAASGYDNFMSHPRVWGSDLGPGTYKTVGVSAVSDPTVSNDQASIYGIVTPSTSVVSNLRIEFPFVYGTRSAGLMLGGSNTQCIGGRVRRCHWGYFPESAALALFTGGGQVACTVTWDGSTVDGFGAPVPGLRPTNMLISGLNIGYSPGLATNGYEFGDVDGLTLMGITVEAGLSGSCGSIATSTGVSIVGGSLRGAAYHGLRLTRVVGATISGLDVTNNATNAAGRGILIEDLGAGSARCNAIRVYGNTFKGNTNGNYEIAASVLAGNDIKFFNNTKVDGTTLPNAITGSFDMPDGLLSVSRNTVSAYAATITNPHQTAGAYDGFGLIVAAGANLNHPVLDLTTALGTLLFRAKANGQVGIHSQAGNALILNTVLTSGIRLLLALQQAGADKVSMGLTSAGLLAFYAADGTTLLASLDPATGQWVKNSSNANVMTLNTSAAAGINVMTTWQRSGATKFSLGMDASDNLAMIVSGVTVASITTGGIASFAQLIVSAAASVNSLNVNTSGAAAGEVKAAVLTASTSVTAPTVTGTSVVSNGETVSKAILRSNTSTLNPLTTAFQDVPSGSLTLSVGRWSISGVVNFLVSGAADVGALGSAQLVFSAGTSNAGAPAYYQFPADGYRGTATLKGTVVVASGTPTVKLQAKKASGTGSSQAESGYIQADFLGN